MSKNTFQPNIAIHPGESLDELLEAVGMSQTELAKRTGLTAKTINEIVQGKNSITPETAIKLASVFGMSAEYWNNKERRYQETMTRLNMQKKLEKETKHLKRFVCYSDLEKNGFFKKTTDQNEKVRNLLNFFGVSSLEFVQDTQPVAFRKFVRKNVSHESLAAWLRAGEIKGNEIQTKKFDKNKLVTAIPKLRSLSRKEPEVYGEEIRKICAECGIAIVYLPHFKNTYVQGATRWLSSDKALIQLSLRNKWEDIFWFDLFHEVGHIVKHGKKEQFLEFENGDYKLGERKEKEADNFAQKTLISDKDLESLKNLTPKAIEDFAKQIDIAPSIVAGRIAYELSKRGDHQGWKVLAGLRRRLQFSDTGS